MGEKHLIKGRIGCKVRGSVEATHTVDLIRSFLSDEEIFGYRPCKKNYESFFNEWRHDWENLLKKISNSYKSKIKYVHPDKNKDSNDVALELTTQFNVVRSRIRNKMNPSKAVEDRLNKSREKKERERDERKVKKNCGICGKEFIGDAKKKYCSVACRCEKANRTARLKSGAWSFAKKECLYCSKEFDYSVRHRKFCSSECRKKASIERLDFLRKIKVKTPEIRICKSCGEEFQATNENRKVCSEKCRRENLKRGWAYHNRKRKKIRCHERS